MLGEEWRNSTVSHGTMRNQDLAPVFIDVVRTYDPQEAESLEKHWESMSVDDEVATDFVHDLFDKLNEVAPEGCYFGAHPGDGSDYGFWEYEGEN